MSDKSFLLETVISPILKSLGELAEKYGISFVAYAEYKDGLIDCVTSYFLQNDASEAAHLTRIAAEVGTFDNFIKRCLQKPELVEGREYLKKLKELEDVDAG